MLVHHQYWNPNEPSLFGKNKANDRAFVRNVDCSLTECPLRKLGTCTMAMRGIGFERCPYGTVQFVEGPTKRSGNSYKFIRDNSKQGVPWLKHPAVKLAFIGDFVYLPYHHMNLCKEVAFIAHGTGFTSGSPFLPREHWTIDNVVRLIQFRPQAIFGGEITSYQREMIPLFLLHLYVEDRSMWDAVAKRLPEYSTPPSYVGRKALLRTLKHPITWTTGHDAYPVKWTWDGEKARTATCHAYSSTWGNLPAKELMIELVPEENASIVIADNDWVTSETVLVD